MKKKIEKVKTLLDILPYIKKHKGKTFIIKYGGTSHTDKTLKATFAKDIFILYLLGINIVIVHGEGKVEETLTALDLKSKFVDGYRYLDEKTLEIVEMVLSGNVNKAISSLLNSIGAKALGLSGKDASFIKAKAKNLEKYGLLGEIDFIDKTVLQNLFDDKFIPVVSSIAASSDDINDSYAVCTNEVACSIASSLKASKLIFISDYDGLYDNDNLEIKTLDKNIYNNLKRKPNNYIDLKLNYCFEAVENGVEKAHIIDGNVEHSLLLEIFTSEGIGLVVKESSYESKY